MTALHKYIKCKTWRGRVKVVYLYYTLKKVSLRKTAKYFHISLGAASEAVFLAERLSQVKTIVKRRDAINFLKGK